MIRRLASGVGRTLITIGVLMLLFVAYQLWGTGIETSQKQDKAEADFAAILAQANQANQADQADQPGSGSGEPSESLLAETLPAEVPAETVPLETVPLETVPTTSTAMSAKPVPTTKPVLVPATKPKPKTTVRSVTITTLPQVRAGRSKQIKLKTGQGVGRIQIKSINFDWIFVEGADALSLKAGPGHYVRTPMPGQPGNAAIACHRTTFSAPCFNLDRVQPGAEILVQTAQGTFRYIAEKQWFVPPKGPVASAVLKPTPGENVLTFTTCHPKYTAQQRLVLRARLQGQASAGDFYEKPEEIETVTTVAALPSDVNAADIGLEQEVDPSTVPEPSAESTAELEEMGFDTVAAAITQPVSSESAGSELALESPASTENGGRASRDASVSANGLESDGHEGTGPIRSLFWFRGHQSIWIKMLGLAGVCAVIWAAAWGLARRRKLIARAIIYGAGFVFLFGPVLFLCFTQLAKLLPESV